MNRTSSDEDRFSSTVAGITSNAATATGHSSHRYPLGGQAYRHDGLSKIFRRIHETRAVLQVTRPFSGVRLNAANSNCDQAVPDESTGCPVSWSPGSDLQLLMPMAQRFLEQMQRVTAQRER